MVFPWKQNIQGWAGNSFVLPDIDIVIGPESSGVVFQSETRYEKEYAVSRILERWRSTVAKWAVGNPMLTIFISGAFVGPLLKKTNSENGGVHGFDDSSTGKTTKLLAACSVWGGPNHKRTWRATSNGIEGVASLCNDGLAALDEVSECAPKDLSEIAYMLGNGQGKHRANRYGGARNVNQWRCFILSTGERTISTSIKDGGFKPKAGQKVRILDLPVNRKFGVFDELHGMASGAALADTIKDAVAVHYGKPGREYLERLTKDKRNFSAILEEVKGFPIFNTNGEGQDKRAAARFALIGLAGELATEYGITGWPEGMAMEAAGEGLRLWRSLRGKGNDEQTRVIQQVLDFIDTHGNARFESLNGDDNRHLIRDRAGWVADSISENWWETLPEGRVYLFTPAGMREALHSFDYNRGLDALQACGALPPSNSDGERSRTKTLDGSKKRRLFMDSRLVLGAESRFG